MQTSGILRERVGRENGSFPSSDTVSPLGKGDNTTWEDVREGRAEATKATAFLCDDRGQSPEEPRPREEVP